MNTKAPFVWTPERDAVLRDVYPSQGREAAAAALGCTASVAKNRAFALRLRRPQRSWTAGEDALVRELFAAGIPTAEAAATLGRGVPATSARAAKLGVHHARLWTDEQVAAVRGRYRADGAKALARELLGGDGPAEVYRVYRLAERLGVTTPTRHPPEVRERVRELHAAGLNDRQIAAALADYFPGRNDRERVTALRNRLGLAAQGLSDEARRANGRRSMSQQRAGGVDPRAAAHRAFARRYGLPEDTPARAVEILLALAAGPRTRPELKAATGRDPVGLWNAVGTSYLSGLVRRGLVASTPLTWRGAGTPRATWFLTPHAIDLLAAAGTTEAA